MYTPVRATTLLHLLLASLSIVLMTSVANASQSPESSRLNNLGNGIVQEDRTGKMWQHDYSKTFRSYGEVEQYIKGQTLAGYNDRRLPTRDELYELAMMFDLKEAGDVRMQIEGNYWLTDKDGKSIVGSWEIGDQCEPERFFFSKQRGRVRLVRQ